MESKSEYGQSPLVAFINAIENITLSMWGKFRISKCSNISYDDYRKNPEVIEAVNELLKFHADRNN